MLKLTMPRKLSASAAAAALACLGATALINSGSATGQESPQMPSSTVSLLQNGERTGLSARVHQMASSPALEDRGMKLADARKFRIAGATWSAVPATTGACLVSPAEQIVCVKDDAVAAGRLMAMIANHEPDAGVVINEIVGLAPDGIRTVQLVDDAGQLLREAKVTSNAYRLDLAGLKGPKKIQFVTDAGEIVPFRT